jgi:hypothetical protein
MITDFFTAQTKISHLPRRVKVLFAHDCALKHENLNDDGCFHKYLNLVLN